MIDTTRAAVRDYTIYIPGQEAREQRSTVMSPHRLIGAHPLAVFFTAPLARMAEIPLLPATALTSAAAALAQAVHQDLFWRIIFPGVVFASGFDWWYGRRQARITDTFRAEVALIGLHQKIGAIGIVCFIRWLEYGGPDLFGTGGVVAAVIGAGLIVEEVSSVEEKRILSGAKPIFLLSAVLSAFRGVLQRLTPSAAGTVPPSPAPPPDIQQGDHR